MQDWTQGYVNDVGYVHDYYPELNSQHVRLAPAATWLDLPDFDFIGMHGVWTWISDA